MTLPFNLTRPLVAFDLETTSANPRTARIVEIAVVRFGVDGSRTDYATLINPGISIPAEATAIHGITDDDVLGKPRWEDKAPALMRAFRGSDFMGFNVRYDLEVLQHECKRVGVDAELQVGDQPPRVIDPLRLLQIKEPRALSDVYTKFTGKTLDDAHSAVADIDATLEVLVAQFARWPDLSTDLDILHELQFPRPEGACTADGRLGRNVHGLFLTFGAHAGVPLNKVPADYIKWVLGPKGPTLSTDTRKTLEGVKR